MTKKQKLVADFNSKYEIGDKVKIKLDDGTLKEVTIEYEAQLLGGHTPIGWFKEIGGCYLLNRVQS